MWRYSKAAKRLSDLFYIEGLLEEADRSDWGAMGHTYIVVGAQREDHLRMNVSTSQTVSYQVIDRPVHCCEHMQPRGDLDGASKSGIIT